MADISLIKKLREITQAGFSDVKKALEENNNDLEKATQWLREKGIAKASKKAGAIATEGIVKSYIKGNKALILEINCQTDFVAMSDNFVSLVDLITLTIFEHNPNSVQEANNLKTHTGNTIEIACNELSGKLGEKISLRRFEFINKNDDQSFGHYIHSNNKIVVVVVVDKPNKEQIGKDVSMHAAAMNPKFLNETFVDKNWLENEKKILTTQANEDPKILTMKQKMPKEKFEIQWQNILNGKIKKTLSEVCLVDQIFVKDPSKTISQFLKVNDCSLISFIRYEVGEGMEMKVNDFAQEIAEQMHNTNG